MSTQTTPHFDLPAEHPRYPNGGRLTWEVALGFPPQGKWTPAEYFALEDFIGGGFRAELVEGHLEVLPMPKEIHQFIAGYLYRLLCAWVEQYTLGNVAFSGLRVRVANGESSRYREPDVVFMKMENDHRRNEDFWDGADLVMEVASESPTDQERDYQLKTADYSAARIPEYWIIDPLAKRIRVLVLEGDSYRLHGDFFAGQMVPSVVLPGFSVSVDLALAGGKKK